MISVKLASFIKANRKNTSDIDLFSIQIMFEVDRILKKGYIKSRSSDDRSYIKYVSDNVYSQLEATSDRGMIREGIFNLLSGKSNRSRFETDEIIAMQILYSIDSYCDIRSTKEYKSDNRLMSFTQTIDESLQIFKSIEE